MSNRKITSGDVENFSLFRQIYTCFLLTNRVFLIEQPIDLRFREATKTFPHHVVVNPQSGTRQLE